MTVYVLTQHWVEDEYYCNTRILGVYGFDAACERARIEADALAAIHADRDHDLDDPLTREWLEEFCWTISPYEVEAEPVKSTTDSRVEDTLLAALLRREANKRASKLRELRNKPDEPFGPTVL